MELLGKDIESFEHYKSLVDQYADNDSFRQELVDRFFDCDLHSVTKRWAEKSVEAQRYADYIETLKLSVEESDSTIFQRIIDFFNKPIPKIDYTAFWSLEQLNVDEEINKISLTIKILKRALENITVDIYCSDNDGSILYKESLTFSLNVVPDTKICRVLTFPRSQKSIVNAELFYNNKKILTPISFQDLKFSYKGVSFIMIAVSGGKFTMGASDDEWYEAGDDEKRRHNVTLSDFYIGQIPVTRSLWNAIMSNNSINNKQKDFPVTNITWQESCQFIFNLNKFLSHKLRGWMFALPTEAQWEYAARGGNKSKGYRYSGSNNLNDVGWTDSHKLHLVAQKSPNELGIYDMSGNIYEWCNDWYGKYSEEEQIDPSGQTWGSHRVIRGGSYDRFCRVSARSCYPKDERNDTIGFRLVLVNTKNE